MQTPDHRRLRFTDNHADAPSLWKDIQPAGAKPPINPEVTTADVCPPLEANRQTPENLTAIIDPDDASSGSDPWQEGGFIDG